MQAALQEDVTGDVARQAAAKMSSYTAMWRPAQVRQHQDKKRQQTPRKLAKPDQIAEDTWNELPIELQKSWLALTSQLAGAQTWTTSHAAQPSRSHKLIQKREQERQQQQEQQQEQQKQTQQTIRKQQRHQRPNMKETEKETEKKKDSTDKQKTTRPMKHQLEQQQEQQKQTQTIRKQQRHQRPNEKEAEGEGQY